MLSATQATGSRTTTAPRHGAVVTIPSGVAFVDALAAGLLAESGGDPLVLARATVLLPTRRAVRALREAFLRLSGGRPTLLPRLRPLGDVDEEEWDFAAGADWLTPESLPPADLPPAIPGLRRQLLLAQLVRKMGEASLPVPPDEAQSARLAQALADLLDQVQTERLDFAALQDLAPERYAAHWQQTLSFLTILTEHWPRLLAAEGCLDPAERQEARQQQGHALALAEKRFAQAADGAPGRQQHGDPCQGERVWRTAALGLGHQSALQGHDLGGGAITGVPHPEPKIEGDLIIA